MKYKKGSGAIPGIPARDLDPGDIEKFVVPLLLSLGIKKDPAAWLVDSGLYEAEKKKTKELKITGEKDGE